MGNETLTLVAHDTVNRAATHYLENAPSLDITEKGQLVFADEPSNKSMKPMALFRNKFSLFTTIPCRGLSLSR
jgi:hypothetical protein